PRVGPAGPRVGAVVCRSALSSLARSLTVVGWRGWEWVAAVAGPEHVTVRPNVSLIVQKYGGTSVADTDRIRAVAEHVVRTRRHGNEVVVVVSAMGKSTDDLLRLANDLHEEPPPRELDMLLTAGERISMSLLCIAISRLGEPSASFT